MIEIKKIAEEMNEALLKNKKHIRVEIRENLETLGQPRFSIKHYYHINDKVAEYNTMISYQHYWTMGHKRFMRRLWELLSQRMGEKTKLEFDKTLKKH